MRGFFAPLRMTAFSLAPATQNSLLPTHCCQPTADNSQLTPHNLVGSAAFEGDGTAGFGFEDVAVFGGYGVDAEVPDTEVDLLLGDEFHQGVLAEVEGL